MSATSSAFAALLGAFLVIVVLWSITHPQLQWVTADLGSQPTGTRIDVNQADAATLTLLPGVGPGIADHILAARQAGAVFHGAVELEAVKFIGPTLIRRIEPWIRYAPVPESREMQP